MDVEGDQGRRKQSPTRVGRDTCANEKIVPASPRRLGVGENHRPRCDDYAAGRRTIDGDVRVSKLEEMETSLGATHPDGVEAAAGAVTKRLPAFVYYSMSDTRPKIMLSGKKVAPAPVVARKAIADLVPYEGAVVGSKVDALRAALQAGTAVPPPKVMQIGTDFLVQDGNHRVCAAKLEGRADMDVEVVAKDQRFADALRHALRRGRKGFEAMTTVADDAARIAFTNAEEEDDGTFDLAASLQAKLGTEPSSGE